MAGRARKGPLLRNCRTCDEPIPPQTTRGRPREQCETCRPGVQRTPAVVNLSPVVDLDVLGLETRGRELWDEMVSHLTSPLHRTLLLEACRLADRGERLHALLRGERGAWVVLKLPDMFRSAGLAIDDEIEISVNISSVAIEARNTAMALKGLVGELRRSAGQAGAVEDDDPLSGIDDEVAAKRRARSS
jgi:hypothetical protein